MKKIAVIGRGTAGAMSAAFFKQRFPNFEIEWYYDPNIEPQAVGEGSTPGMVGILHDTVHFMHDDLDKIDGTFKYGVRKMNWGIDGADEYFQNIRPPQIAYHFNAIALQKLILERISDKVKIFEKHVTQDQLDADYIVDCSGKPTDYSEYTRSKYIPVNAVYVNQCFWEKPEFQYTLAIARPYGWVFGVPLQNRCAIGYLYNHTINTLEEVQEDIKEVFSQFQLTPSTKELKMRFNSYSRKINFTDRVCYNGNKSCFLEPLETGAFPISIAIDDLFNDVITKKMTPDAANSVFHDKIQDIERVVMLHYFAGSKFKTPFWDFAMQRGAECINGAMKETIFRAKYNIAKIYDFDRTDLRFDRYVKDPRALFWRPFTFCQNIHQLGIREKLDSMIGE